MKTLRIQQIGEHAGVVVEAPNDYHAVARAAGCAVNDVPLPIWQSTPGRHGRTQRCYMPLDNTGRQWLVEDAA